MPEVIFKIDLDHECYFAYDLIKQNIIKDFKRRYNHDISKMYKLPFSDSFCSKIEKMKYKQAKPLLKKKLSVVLKNNKNKLENKLKLLTKEWKSIETLFFKEYERISGYPWRYKRYYSYLTVMPLGKKYHKSGFFVSSRYKPKASVAIVAHELLHHHLNDFFYKNRSWFKKRGIGYTFWLDYISELLILILLKKDKRLRFRFPKKQDELIKKYEIMKKWKSRKSFKEFVFYVSKSLKDDKKKSF